MMNRQSRCRAVVTTGRNLGVSIRTTCYLVVCLAISAANVSCNQSGTAASRREVAREKAVSSEPIIQRRRVVEKSEVLPEHGASPHFRIDDGPQQHEVAAKRERKLPPVFLSEQHKASCLLSQDDMMPDVRLPDLEGNEQSLSSLLGSKATVVCFWTSTSPMATWQLSDLGPDVLEKYGPQGVHVVAINFKEAVETARVAANKAQLSNPVLLDSQGMAFQQVASDYLPRTYVLDAKGKILWLDIGYSTETQRHLELAIRYALSHH